MSTPTRQPVDRLGDALVDFWAERGCVPRIGCTLPLPVGLMHPDALFALAARRPPEGSVFVQRIRRPLDGRGDGHPCRWFRHRQLVVAHPEAPPDLLGVLRASLWEGGIDPGRSDLRFRAHRWRTRTLGLRGVGWRVLAGGMKVARVGWLERLVGRELEPRAFEVTYGLDRLAVVAGGDLPVAEPAEGELTRWAREVVDAAELSGRLGAELAEADRCLEAGLARPAYERAVRGVELVDLIAAGGRLGPRGRQELLDGISRRVEAAIEIARCRADGVSGSAAEGRDE